MQHRSNKLLFQYWNTVRDGRLAPHRYEIEPVKISNLLPDIFILECAGVANYRFRLAGTRMCEQLGHELRGCNLLDYWQPADREAIQSLLHTVMSDGAGVVFEFEHTHGDRGTARFETILLPLIQSDTDINRMLGCIATLNHPYWLGTIELRKYKLTWFDLVWPEGSPRFLRDQQGPEIFRDSGARTVGDARRRFRVVEGGLASRSD